MKTPKILSLAAILSLASGSALAVEPKALAGILDVVPAFSTNIHQMVGVGGAVTQIVVEGGSHTDLDVYVYDANGNLIGADTGRSSFGVVTWTPRWTGKFFVHVVNRGSAANLYRITLASA